MNASEGGSGGQDFDLNIAPIIDCFTVLIAYLLVTASFLSLSVFDVGVAVSGEAATPQTMPTDPPLTLTLQVNDQRIASLRLSGGHEHLNVVISLPAQNDAIDVKGLDEKTQEMHAKYPDLKETSLMADPSITYKEIVKVIETVTPHFPKLYLSGEKVSLLDAHEKSVQ